MKNIATIYARVSTPDQEETGYSLPSQEKLLVDYSARKSFEVKKVYAVAESASGAKRRKIFAEMMEYMRKHNINHLVVEKVDRLTRNFREAIIVDDWIDEDADRFVHFVKQNLILHKNSKSDEKFRWDIEIVLAKKYCANLSEEVRKGQKEKIAQGWLPTKPPLGYKTIGDKGHKIHIIDQDKAAMIRKMFELYLTGNYSTKFLVKVMFDEGLRNRQGGKVGKSRIYDMLTDPFVSGKIRWKGEIFQGKHEAVVSEDLYDAVQHRINRKLKHPMHRKHVPVFKAKIECSECRSAITWETQKGHWYGHCSGYQKLGQERPCVQKRWFRQEAIEDKLFPHLIKIAPKNERVLKLLEKALKEDHEEEVLVTRASHGDDL
jgi:DNA invertase Pin-like site-specific DNA recombinase